MCETRLTYALDKIARLEARVEALEQLIHSLDIDRHYTFRRIQELADRQKREHSLNAKDNGRVGG